MLFFGSRCERLCMMQFSLISLIPGLLRRLEDCADPELDSYGKNMVRPTSLKTSERSSRKDIILLCWMSYSSATVLAYMGLPLQIFGKVNISTICMQPPLTLSTRAAFSDLILLCNSLILLRTLVQSPTLLVLQIRSSSNKKIATATSS